MCNDCLKEKMPDRGSTCLEGGAYLLNYAGCHVCGVKGVPGEEGRVREEEDGEEVITFKRTSTTYPIDVYVRFRDYVCSDCGHVIATHKYSFSVDEEFQEYSMQCLFCGHGQATVSILSDDPREQQLF